MRTIGVTTDANGITDLDGTVVDGLEALRQRVHQALQFFYNTWFLASQRGIRPELVRGHETTVDVAGAAITATIRDEGGDEITGINPPPFVRLNYETRTLTYKATIQTIYGDMEVSEAITT